MLELFQTPITVVHVFVCLVLVLVILIQPGKSGGLGAALGGAGAQQIFGGRGAGNLLTKVTWVSATTFFLTSITLAYVATSTGDTLKDLAEEAAPAEPDAPAAEATGESDSDSASGESATDTDDTSAPEGSGEPAESEGKPE